MTTRRGFLGALGACALIPGAHKTLPKKTVHTSPVFYEGSGRRFIKLPASKPVHAGEVVVCDSHGIRPAKTAELYVGENEEIFFGIAASDAFYGEEAKVLLRDRWRGDR